MGAEKTITRNRAGSFVVERLGGEEVSQANLKKRALAALRLIDGFDAGEVAQLCCCTLAEAEEALNDLKASGDVISEYEAMRGYVWRVIR